MHNLYEGELVYTETSLRAAMSEGRLIQWRGTRSLMQPPKVTLGQPMWWSLRQLAEVNDVSLLPVGGRMQLSAEFFLVRLACAFLSPRRTFIEHAKLSVHLDAEDEQTRVLDAFPRPVAHKKSVPSPEVVNQLISSLGSQQIEAAYRYPATTVIGCGQSDTTATWLFTPQADRPIVDGYMLYMIVACPTDAQTIHLQFTLEADLQTQAGWLQARLDQPASVPIMCGPAEKAQLAAN